MQESLVNQIVALIRKRYPDWNSFENPGFKEDEIVYKRAAAGRAAESLQEDQVRKLLEKKRFDEILERIKKLCRSTNLLYLGVPRTGDLAALHAEGLDKPSFCAAVVDFLYGPGDSPERLDRFVVYLEKHNRANRWAFPTYLLFLCFPESDFFVKPRVTKWFLKLAEDSETYTPRPDGNTYSKVLRHVRKLRSDLEPYGAQDMIDVQSALWVGHSEIKKDISSSAGKHREMERLFDECIRSYLSTPKGQEHEAVFESGRRKAQKSYREILKDRDAGEDVTNRVLLELLPYTDSASNREKGAWIHVAPAITGDLKGWFEAKGWQKPGQWPEVAQAILQCIERSVADPAELEAACKEFSEQDWSTGFQAGMLTPILNALKPDDFLLVNNKSRRLINYLSGKSLSQKLIDYPEINRIGQSLIEDLADMLGTAPTDARPEDVFDAFSHWLNTIRKFPFQKSQYWKIAPPESAKYWDDYYVGGFISIGWNELGDLTNPSRDEFEQLRDQLVAERKDWSKEGVEQVWKFAHEIREGDKIVANEGTSRVLGFGTVTGPYEYVPDALNRHHLPVDWEDTKPRRVQEGGWKRTLIKLDKDKFNSLIDQPPDVEASERLTQQAFDLLKGLSDNPNRAYYTEHQADFKRWVEVPFQDLMHRVISLLPKLIINRMETEKRLFSRILKNDFGRGGAWPFYWGALYPIGGKRIEDAQLALVVKHDRLNAGFFIGEYGSDSRKRFLKNVARHQEQLQKILEAPLSRPDLLFGDLQRFQDEMGVLHTGETPSWREWLKNPSETGISVSRVFKRKEILETEPEMLADELAKIYQELFPLVLLCISDEPLDDIHRFMRLEPDDSSQEVNKPFPIPDLAAELRMDPSILERWVRAINRKGQAIIYGPPGTGKTYAARSLARHLIGGGDGFRELVQFHPSYAYEDFIQGIRPEPLPDGGLDYPIKRGRFLDFCVRASGQEGTCVLIIDEINRAHISRVFGELMYLLEYREESIPLASGGGPLSIPENVRVIGTMNTADRSIALVDHALRRRFTFLELRPSYETLRRFHEGKKYNVEPLIDLLEEVNLEIGDPHYEVGITYFLIEDLPSNFEDVWTMEVLPYLEEYFFDQPDKRKQFQWSAIQERIDL